jgi:hypothetical protein
LKNEIKVCLLIDGKEIPLNHFAQQIIASTITGMISVLKGIPENFETVNLTVKRTK